MCGGALSTHNVSHLFGSPQNHSIPLMHDDRRLRDISEWGYTIHWMRLQNSLGLRLWIVFEWIPYLQRDEMLFWLNSEYTGSPYKWEEGIEEQLLWPTAELTKMHSIKCKGMSANSDTLKRIESCTSATETAIFAAAKAKMVNKGTVFGCKQCTHRPQHLNMEQI